MNEMNEKMIDAIIKKAEALQRYISHNLCQKPEAALERRLN